MSKDELLVKLNQVRALTDAAIDILSHPTTVPFSLDDEYEADYLISCLESNCQKLCTMAKKCQHPAAKSVEQEQNVVESTAKMTAMAADSSCVKESVNQSAVENFDSDDTASMDSSEMSIPICGSNVSH